MHRGNGRTLYMSSISGLTPKKFIVVKLKSMMQYSVAYGVVEGQKYPGNEYSVEMLSIIIERNASFRAPSSCL